MFIKKYDSTKYTRIDYETPKMTEIFDSNSFQEKGHYKFDEYNRLRFYAFLVDDSNGYYFSINYDTLGRMDLKNNYTVQERFHTHLSRFKDDARNNPSDTDLSTKEMELGNGIKKFLIITTPKYIYY